MDQSEPQGNSIESADLHVTIFPHLDEFMAIDVRDKARPQVRVVNAKELLTPDHYRELEQELAALIRAPGPPFLSLITLPARMQAAMQEKGAARLAKLLAGGGGGHRISLFICAGPIVAMTDEEADTALQAFFQDSYPKSFVELCGATFRRLLRRERTFIVSQEREQLRRAVLGESDQFYTMWQRPGGGPSPQ